MSNEIQLKKGQEIAVKRVVMWYKLDESNLICRIGGYAGTGKSFIIKYIIKELGLEMEQVEFAAFTGNATVNLIRKGNKMAKTIHKLIYNTRVTEYPIWKTKKGRIVKASDVISTDEVVKQTEKDEFGSVQKTLKFENGVLSYETTKMIDKNTKEEVRICDYRKDCITERRDYLENPMCKLIVIDEFSMCSDKMIEDLKSFGIKILLVGDRGQLPPVNSTNSYVDEYEAELTEIVRQGKGSPIIDASILARKKVAIPYGDYGDEEHIVNFSPKELFFDHIKKFIKWADQIIVGKNATRKKINETARKILGFKGKIPQVGEKIVCNNNSWNTSAYSTLLGCFIPLVNGARGYVKEVQSVDWTNKVIYLDFQIDFDETCVFQNLPVSFKNFDESVIKVGSNEHEFDFGYAVTCHKSQGNQYGKVVVLAESFWIPELKGIDIESERKWLYTAITRAENELIVFYDKKYYMNKGYKKDEDYYDAIDEYYDE